MLQQQSEEARGKAQRLQRVEVEEVFLSSGDLSGIRLLVLCALAEKMFYLGSSLSKSPSPMLLVLGLVKFPLSAGPH